MAKVHGPQIKDDAQYEALRRQGASKEKAARIANTGRKAAGRRGGKAARYQDWTKQELLKRARELGIERGSKMDKGDLIGAIRKY